METSEPSSPGQSPRDCRNDIFELTDSGTVFTVDHIRLAAKAIYSNHNEWTDVDEFEKVFLATKFHPNQQQTSQNEESQHDTKALVDVLSDFSTCSRGQHLCIIASMDENNWITIFLIKAVGTVGMLYFDPCGSKPSEALLSKVQQQVSLAEVVAHAEDPALTTMPFDSYDTAPACLRYYETILSLLSRGEDVTPKMQSKSFYQVLAELNMQGQQRKLEILAVKDRLQKLCYLQQAVEGFSILCSNHPNLNDFKLDLNKSLKNFASINEVKEDLSVHLNLLEKMTVLQADLGNLDEDLLKQLEAAKQAVYGSTFVKMILKRGEDLTQNTTGRFEASHFIDEGFQRMRAKYPKLLDAVSEFLKILISCSHYSNISTGDALLKICTLLELDWPTFYDMVHTKLNEYFPKVPMEILTSSEGIDSFLQSLANDSTDHQEHGNFQDNELVTQWLQELRDFRKQNQTSDMDSLAVHKLEKAYNDFQSQANNWKKASAIDIYNWAREAKRERKKPIPEIIAVMDRAYQILTKGKRLRASQVLALLLVEGASPIKGKILHIPPEEGTRSTDIAMIATLKILRGESTVDIITSHPTVADASLRCSADFYRLFQIHFATNNDGNNEAEAVTTHALKTCYLAELVYGTMETFQRDYLLDVFGERRGNRSFGTLILDEIDHMPLNDNSSMEEISSTFPDMESLRYIYVEIWVALLATEESYPREVRESLNNKWWGLHRSRDEICLEIRRTLFADYRDEVKNLVYESVHTQIKETVEKVLEAVPNHLIQFVMNSMDKWIDSAILAMYKLKENEDYCLKPVKGGATVVMPIPQNNAHSQEKVLSSNGICQFLQLKHNLDLTSESFATCRTSSYGYINLYGPSILGLTSALGSTAEQELLEKAYYVEFMRIPHSRTTQVEEITTTIIKDPNWAKLVAVASYMKCMQQGRAVLTICKTVEDCREVEECLKMIDDIIALTEGRLVEEPVMKSMKLQKLYEIYDTTVSPILDQGHIILAPANVAKCVNFGISEEVKSGGVVYVCLGFYPKTLREKETLLRSAYLGNRGMAQLIVRLSEVDAVKQYLEHKRKLDECESESSMSSYGLSNLFNIDCSESWYPVMQIMNFWSFEAEKNGLYNLEDIYFAFVENERDCVEKVLNSTLPKLHLQHRLFHNFWQLSHRLYNKYISNSNLQFSLQNLHEGWSIWMSSMDATAIVNSVVKENQGSETRSMPWKILKSQLNKKSKDLFKEFEDLALSEEIICYCLTAEGRATQCNHSSSKSYSNPYYALQEAVFHSRLENAEKAAELIETAIVTGAGNDQLLFCAYVKKFHTAISSACKENELTALMKCEFEGMDSKQKEEAKQSLSQAMHYLSNHKKYLEDLVQRLEQILPTLSESLKKNTLFLKWETPEPSIPRMLSSKLFSLRLDERLVSHLLKCVKAPSVEEATTVERCLSATCGIVKPKPAFGGDIQQLIQKATKAELERAGLETLQDFYAAPEIQNLLPCYSRQKIAAGMLALSEMSVASCSTTIGCTLILDGIMDIALQILDVEEDSKAQSRLIPISYCMSLLLSENLAISLQTAQLLRRGEEACRFVSSELKSRSQIGCNSLANQFKTLGDLFCKASHAITYEWHVSSSISLDTVEIKSIPVNLAISAKLDKVQLSQQVIGARMMERQEAIFVQVLLDDFKTIPMDHTHKELDEFRELIKYVNKDQFLEALHQAFDNSFEDIWTANSNDVIDEIKSKYSDLDDRSNNFYDGYQDIIHERLKNFDGVALVLMGVGNAMPLASSTEVRTLEELIQHKTRVVMKGLKKKFWPKPWKTSDGCTNASNDTSLLNDVELNAGELSKLSTKFGMDCKLSGDVSLEKIQLAYMMTVQNLLRDSEFLEHFIKDGKPSLESLQITSERLRHSFQPPLKDHDSFDTIKAKKDLLSGLLKERLQRKIEWHRQIQWKYWKLLSGFPQLECTDSEKNALEDFPDGHCSNDTDFSCGVPENQPSGPKKNSLLKPPQGFKSGHTISRYSSPKRGLEFMKNEMSVQVLFTFVDISSQVKALNACLRMLQDELSYFFLSCHVDCEVHVDVTQLNLDFELECCELSRDGEGNPVQRSNLSPVRFISMFVGYKPPSPFYDKQRLFYVQTIFPRVELPDGLVECKTWYVIPRKPEEIEKGKSRS